MPVAACFINSLRSSTTRCELKGRLVYTLMKIHIKCSSAGTYKACRSRIPALLLLGTIVDFVVRVDHLRRSLGSTLVCFSFVWGRLSLPIRNPQQELLLRTTLTSVLILINPHNPPSTEGAFGPIKVILSFYKNKIYFILHNSNGTEARHLNTSFFMVSPEHSLSILENLKYLL